MRDFLLQSRPVTITLEEGETQQWLDSVMEAEEGVPVKAGAPFSLSQPSMEYGDSHARRQPGDGRRDKENGEK